MDKIEDELGKPTLYQIRSVVVAALLLLAATSTAQTGVFYNAIPNHRCLLPAVDNIPSPLNATTEETIEVAIPEGDSCHQYLFINGSSCLNKTDFPCFGNSKVVVKAPCKFGYVYDPAHFEKTVVSEWDLVCSDQIWNSFTKSIYFAGALFGAPPTGYLVDRFGRKRMSVILGLGLLVAGIGCSFALNFWTYCVFRFIEGLTSLPLMIALYSYANEMVCRKYRTVVGTTLPFTSAVVHAVQPLAAYLIRNWRHLNLFFALLTLPYLLLCPFIPETPRWLLMKRRTREAKKVLLRAFESGGKTMSPGDWNDLIAEEMIKSESHDNTSEIADFFRRPYTRVVSVITMYLWFSTVGVFYGLVLNVGTLAGDPYLNAALNGFTEILGILIYSSLVFKFGSLFSLRSGLFGSGTMCFVAMAAKQFSQNGIVPLQVVRWSSIAGKLFISISFCASYQYTLDVNPTVSRGKAMGLTASFGRIGSILMPFLLPFQVGKAPAADIVFGVLGISGACLCFLLPNTSKNVFLSTLDDAEDYYRENMSRLSACIGRDSIQVQEEESDKKLVNNNENV